MLEEVILSFIAIVLMETINHGINAHVSLIFG